MSSSRNLTLAVLALALSTAGCGRHRVATSPEAPAAEAEQASAVENLRGPALDEYIQRVREMSWNARPPIVRTGLATVENSNPALAAALAALAVFPSPRRHIDVAREYRKAGILDKAHEHLSLAAHMDYRNAAAYDGMARIWRDWGFPNMGLPDAYRAVYHAPSSPEAHNTLGTILQALGREKGARQEYERSLELNDSAAYALNNLCSLDLLAGDASTAALRCEQAVRLDPGLAVAARNLEQARAILRAVAVEAPDGSN